MWVEVKVLKNKSFSERSNSMATELKILKRRALKGMIREIKNNCTMSLIRAEIDDEDISVASELSKQEVERLNLKTGDAVDMFPIDYQTYLIIGKSE